MLEIGNKMPSFKLLDQDGNLLNSKTLLGTKTLIYFYPKDDTPGCTTEACGFRDMRYELEESGVKVFGISKDSVRSHKKFADKYKLPFTLLSDESTDVIQKFGAWREKSMYGKKYFGINRISYLFDEKGKVVKVWGKVDTKNHAKDVLEFDSQLK